MSNSKKFTKLQIVVLRASGNTAENMNFEDIFKNNFLNKLINLYTVLIKSSVGSTMRTTSVTTYL